LPHLSNQSCFLDARFELISLDIHLSFTDGSICCPSIVLLSAIFPLRFYNGLILSFEVLSHTVLLAITPLALVPVTVGVLLETLAFKRTIINLAFKI